MAIGDYLSALPEELALRVFSETTPITLTCLAQVAKIPGRISVDPLLWQYMSNRVHLPPKQQSKEAKEDIQQLYGMLKKNYPPALIMALGGIEKFACLPILNIGKRMSPINRINFIKLEEVAGHSIWRGVDLWQRPFITFVIEKTDKEDKSSFHIQTLHQKHRGIPGATGLWVSAGAEIIPHEPISFEFISKLIKQEMTIPLKNFLPTPFIF